MKRDEWQFVYTATVLSVAAQKKIDHHNERLAFWKQTKTEVMATIRSEGLEIDEKIALGYRSPKSRDWDNGAEIMVRNDLRKDLTECMEKLGAHTERLNQYEGWQQVLAANPEDRLQLDIQDWLFFFGRE